VARGLKELDDAIAELRTDRISGASAMLDAALDILRRSRPLDVTVETARAICRAQPSMAPLWNAALHAVAGRNDPELFERFAERTRRAPAALARAADALLLGIDRPELRLLTLSSSASVLRIVDHLHASHPVTIVCGEGRPALEGRLLASRLAASGIQVEYFADGALALGLERSDAVLIGADAIGPQALINKAGSLTIAAAASRIGRPVYVAATRDKFVMPALWPHLALRDGPSDEIWADAPRGVTVRNPYFETVPLDLVSSIISDAGLLAPDLAADACAAMQTAGMLEALECLVGDTGAGGL
jgi:translation initiation factor 2B subunit (eIF-2B alpha/beta/delta family)